jgi:putative hydrolase of the HAD superfamily
LKLYNIGEVNMSKVKVVSFDAEGTLVTLDFSHAVWHEGIPSFYARKHGLSLREARAFIEQEYHEVGAQKMEWYDIKYWLKRFELGDCHDQILKEYSHKVSCYPDASEVLSSLSRDYTLIVVSCSTREFLPFLLADLEQYFNRVFSTVSDYGQIKTPELFLEISRQMGVAPYEMAHVGDLWEQDYLAAKEASVKAFHLDRTGECKEGKSLASLVDLEAKLRRR